MIFVRFPFNCNLKVLECGHSPAVAKLIKSDIVSYLGYDQFSLVHNGKLLYDMDVVPDDSTIQVTFSLPGGKGGFGSMLRAIGAQIEKTTNREACRDLSGRRLRDINEEQRLKKWISKEGEREAEKIRRRQARIERLKSKAPHNFFDFEYEKEISELPNRINDALTEGLEKAKQPNKRPLEKTEIPKKSWLSDDFPVSSSDSELEERSFEGDSSPKKPKMVSKGDLSCNSDDTSGSSQPLPCSSKDSCFTVEESSTSCDSKPSLTEGQSEEGSVDSQKGELEVIQMDTHDSNVNITPDLDTTANQLEKDKLGDSTKNSLEIEKTTEEDHKDVSKLDGPSIIKGHESKDDSPIDLLDFQSVSEFEALGLDRLKSALIHRGLKCGGTLTDRAQRLWKVRGLQPHEYPANLVAKNKK